MKSTPPIRLVLLWGCTLVITGLDILQSRAEQTGMDRAIDGLILVLGDKEANGEKLEETNRAIRALVAIGKPAVPKLIDAILGSNNNAIVYAGLALKEMTTSEAHAAIRERWNRLGEGDRWRLVPYITHHQFGAIVPFALASLRNKDERIRKQAWEFIIKNHQAQIVGPAKEPFLKALSGQESATVRWSLLTDKIVFDEKKENEILIALLRSDSWVAKGEKRVYCCTTPPWWPDGRELVIPILGKRKVKSSVPALLNVLAEKGPGRAYLGHLIIPILADLGDKESIPELKRILEMPSEKHEPTLWGKDYIHVLAAGALLQLGDAAGRTKCRELLKSKEALASGKAAFAFAQFGTQEDLDILEKLLDREEWQIQREVCKGLERITGVVNRAPNWTVTTENDAPLWREWLRKNRKK